MPPPSPPFPGYVPAWRVGLAASIALGWRATTRAPAYRVLGALMAALGLAGPFLVSAFLFFVEEHTRAEFLAANVALWSVVFAFLLLPRRAVELGRRTLPTFNALVPAPPEAVLVGRYLGILGAYLAVVLVQLVPAAVLEQWAFAGRPGLLLTLSLTQIALGAVLVSAILCLAQAARPLFATLCGSLWFLLGTQKGAWIEAVDVESVRLLLSAALAWLPDFTLFSPDPFSDSSNAPGVLGTGARIVYGLFFVVLNLLLAAALVRRQRPGPGPGPGKLARAIRRLR
ncbi:MAG: hypothetical protein JXQ29_14225 [Planctomycetes bacterium]|nr:hypothetical protein [Planctomycetota bacterium]